ncbi:phosphoserine phosphatase SerB [Methylobacillus flagellatus]|uniref:phosphoserine phosphatase SerB n=1 Tax=Methylobacillus flagellatus TaxID=405 RepID=UPI0010F7F27C|nr:phosphoserine phosphatase SerB [Methylobacillus flagellatus]
MRLVVQGPSLPQHDLTELSRLFGDTPFTSLTTTAAVLAVNITQQAAVSDWCTPRQLDHAFVPDELSLSQLGLAVMDMDSTLITIECIDEIADMCGLKPQISAITESAMRGELDFAESLRRRVALLAGLDASALQRVLDERLQLSPGTLDWIAACKQHGIRTMVVSGGFDFFADRVKQLAGLDYAHANQLEIIDGKLTGQLLGAIVDAQAKADLLETLRLQLGLTQKQVVAIGDGANDLKMMAAAGAGVAYRAKPLVRQQASFALNHTGLDGLIHLFSPA